MHMLALEKFSEHINKQRRKSYPYINLMFIIEKCIESEREFQF